VLKCAHTEVPATSQSALAKTALRQNCPGKVNMAPQTLPATLPTLKTVHIQTAHTFIHSVQYVESQNSKTLERMTAVLICNNGPF